MGACMEGVRKSGSRVKLKKMTSVVLEYEEKGEGWKKLLKMFRKEEIDEMEEIAGGD